MVYHILKDGTKVKDITGLVIKKKDNAILYDVIKRIEERGVQVINKN
jgi:DUF1009 family protein